MAALMEAERPCWCGGDVSTDGRGTLVCAADDYHDPETNPCPGSREEVLTGMTWAGCGRKLGRAFTDAETEKLLRAHRDAAARGQEGHTR